MVLDRWSYRSDKKVKESNEFSGKSEYFPKMDMYSPGHSGPNLLFKALWWWWHSWSWQDRWKKVVRGVEKRNKVVEIRRGHLDVGGLLHRGSQVHKTQLWRFLPNR